MKVIQFESWKEAALRPVEAPRADWERAVSGFAVRDKVATDRLDAIAVLPPGHGLGALLTVGADGAVDARMVRVTPEVDAPRDDADDAALTALVGHVCPGISIHAGTPAAPTSLPDHLLLPEADDAEGNLILARPVHEWPWDLGGALGVLARSGGGQIAIIVRNRFRSEEIAGGVSAAHARRLGGTYASEDDRRALSAFAGIVAMRDDPALLSVEVRLSLVQQSELARDLIALALFGTHAGQVADLGETDLRCLAGSRHAPLRLLPTSKEVFAAGAVKATSPDEGLIVGIAGGNQPIRLSNDDRARHSYVIGGTGTGKSTLLKALIAQDICAGEGVVLIDPQGDIANEVAWAIPPEMQDKVIFADAADPAGCFAIGLLPSTDGPEELEHAADALVELFTSTLYANTPEGFGPIFEEYFRKAFFLLAAAQPEDHILANLPRVFEDEPFRRDLLERCQDPAICRFWRKTAHRATGEMDLVNVTNYITSKLTRLVGTGLARRLFPCADKSLDFRSIVDAGKILILRCPKGELGEGLSALAMSAAVLKLRDALAARSSVGKSRRRAVRLYIDEFQSCRGSALQTLLAQGRKFGVSICLANQSLGQVGGATGSGIGAATLANVGNVFVLRVGASDAMVLAPSFERPDRWMEFCRQPDFRMCARILANGRPTTFEGLKIPVGEIPGGIS